MTKEINWEKNTGYLGRNGSFKCNGLSIYHGNDEVFLEPITSKGKIGRCYIRIPKDKLKDFVAALTET